MQSQDDEGAGCASGSASADCSGAEACAAAAGSDTTDSGALPSLLALPDEALVAVLTRLRDPLPLGLACRHTAGLLRSAALPWLLRHGEDAAPWRAPAGRVLTFRPLRGALSPRELAVALLQYTEAVGGAPLEALAAARAALRGQQDPLDVVCALCPHPSVLLLPYLAAGGHAELAAQAAERLCLNDNGLTSSGDGSSRGVTSLGGLRQPLHPAHPELGDTHVGRTALFAALRTRSWGVADVLLRVLRRPTLLAASPAGDGGVSASSSGGEGGTAAEEPPPLGPQTAAFLAAVDLLEAVRGAEEVAARAGCDPPLLSSLLAATDPDAGEGRQHLLAQERQYLLAAAAGSGRLTTLQAALWALSSAPDAPRSVLCQLPQALCAAGRGGHVDAVEALLRNEHMSSRPLEIAALDAAKHGWPPRAVRPVAAAVARRFREEAVRMLAEPMEVALAAGHNQVASVIWEALVQGRPEPERLGRLLVRLASEGDYARALWIADAAPPVMVKVGTAPAAAAAERGHQRVAGLMVERAGRPLPGGRAAAARGRLAEAVRRGDVAAASQLLSEITLGPGGLRNDLVCWAAAAGDLPMLELLLDRLGPWMGEEVSVVSTLVRHGHWRLAPKLHAAAMAGARGGSVAARGELAGKLLRAASKLCAAWHEPHAGLMLFVLQTTTNPAALDLMVSECAEALAASSGSHYLGSLMAPCPESLLALSPDVVGVWTEVMGRLADGSWGLESDPRARGSGGASAGTTARASTGGQASRRSPRGGASGRLPRGAVRFSRRLAQTLANAGDPDLLYQALLFIDRREAELEIG